MVKFSIRRESGTGKIIVKNMETDAQYETGEDSMMRLWDYFIPDIPFMYSDGLKKEGIHVADLSPDFEVGVKNNPYTRRGGYRHRKRSHKKRSHRKRSHRKRMSRRR